MSVAIRAITRLQDADDVNISLGAGVDEYALCWDNDTARFVLRAMSAGLLVNAIEDAATNTVTNVATYRHTTTNTAAIGFGTSFVLQAEVADGTVKDIAKVSANLNDAGPSYGARLVFSNAYIGSLVECMVISGNGNVGIGVTPGVKLQVAGDLSILNPGMIHLGVPGDGGFNGIYTASKTFATLSINGPKLFGWNGGCLGSYAGSQRMVLRWTDSGTVGIGINVPTSVLHALLTDAGTNGVINVLTIGHDTSGTAANGFGAGQLFALESSTTAAQSAARIQALWNDATHATRKADLVLTAYDTAEREGLRIRAAGSAPAIGFLGATPAARIAHVADPTGGGTVDAEARSAINTILATLETFGFHATS